MFQNIIRYALYPGTNSVCYCILFGLHFVMRLVAVTAEITRGNLEENKDLCTPWLGLGG